MSKNSITRFAVLGSLLIVLTVLVAFFLSDAGVTPAVILPTGQGQVTDPAGDGDISLVKVDRDTVQAVIATLERPDAYLGRFTVETFWDDESSSKSVSVWYLSGLKKIEMQSSQTKKHILLTEDRVYIWYEGDTGWHEVGLGGFAGEGERLNDEFQMIPTYEDVLELETENIIEAGYESFNGEYCVYCLVESGAEGILEKYWISVGSGLLSGNETMDNGRLGIRVSTDELIIATPDESVFILPDGSLVT